MRSAMILCGLLSAAAGFADARSWQHVGKKKPQEFAASKLQRDYLAGRQAPKPKFATNSTAKFAVNGTGIPDVDFDVGESYSGYLPISDDPNDKNELFFWFFPSSSNAKEKEILLWLNGGPGCSSFEGLLQENGPFLWQYGTFKPVPNPWAWNRLTNVVWVEQPVGTGFSRGNVTATSEEDVAKQFLGFWKNFVETFSMQEYAVYIAGESYAGMYCPYIASAMLDEADTTYYNVSGMLIYDPVLGNDIVQAATTTVPFVDYHRNLMTFNHSFTAYLHEQHEFCGFADYNAQYLTYPPPGPQPSDYDSTVSAECAGLWGMVINEMFSVNPCFNVYQVAATCPLLWDVLGFPGSFGYVPEGAEVYFDRPEVKRAIHASESTRWEECASRDVFVGGRDASDPPTWRVLPHVIEQTQNVIIGHGTLDMILLPNGTLLSIQNMTWGGQLGFRHPPVEPFYVPYHALSTGDEIQRATDAEALATIAGAGVMGTAHEERGLTYVAINLAGHMVPQYAPSAAFRQLEVLLGRVPALNSTQTFTIEPDYPQVDPESLGNGTGSAMFDAPPQAERDGSVDNSENENGNNGGNNPGLAATTRGAASMWLACGAVLAAGLVNLVL
ncbi:hypothetical protein DL768_007857 [Monosporascus sp. mg162]|nr:hypothetical protein DL768_007857 [Monosporascus sp. mg162]